MTSPLPITDLLAGSPYDLYDELYAHVTTWRKAHSPHRASRAHIIILQAAAAKISRDITGPAAHSTNRNTPMRTP
jgi:hypothetical protein